MRNPGIILSKIPKHSPIPYELLLLADENVKSIDKYIFDCVIYAVIDNEQTIGVCAIHETNIDTIEIKNLAILEKHRNCGIGSRCIQMIEEKYALKNVFVATGDGSVDALRFYKRNGFKEYAVNKDYFLKNYDNPIVENGILLKDQIVLKKRNHCD